MKSFKFISVLLYAFLVAGMDQKSDNEAIIPYKSEQNRNNPFIKMCRDKEILKIIFSFLYGDRNMKKLIDQIPSKIIYSQILKIYRESLVPTNNPFNFSTEKILRLALRNSDFGNIKISNPETRDSIKDTSRRLGTSAKTVEQKIGRNLMFAPLVCIYGLLIVGSVLLDRSCILEQNYLPEEEVMNLIRTHDYVQFGGYSFDKDVLLAKSIRLGFILHYFIFSALRINNHFFSCLRTFLVFAPVGYSSHFAAKVLKFGSAQSKERMGSSFMEPASSVFLCAIYALIIFMYFQYKEFRRNQNLRNRINEFIQNKF